MCKDGCCLQAGHYCGHPACNNIVSPIDVQHVCKVLRTPGDALCGWGGQHSLVTWLRKHAWGDLFALTINHAVHPPSNHQSMHCAASTCCSTCLCFWPPVSPFPYTRHMLLDARFVSSSAEVAAAAASDYQWGYTPATRLCMLTAELAAAADHLGAISEPHNELPLLFC